MMSATSEHTIDQLIIMMCNAESELHLCQADLLDLRKEGPRHQRIDPPRCLLQLCRLNRQASRKASTRMRQIYQGSAAI